MNFEPNVGKILIELDQDSGKTAGGLIIPSSVVSEGSKVGTVKAAGPTRLVDGKPTALLICPGDRVVVDPLGATKIKVDGRDMLLLRCEDVLGRVN